jgi:beta-lactamase superfamily II metal-dependent hydrolase
VRAGSDEAILYGDAEDDGLRAWMRAFGGTRARLVLWPHHGSDMDSIDPLLRATNPSEIWISASGDPPVHAELSRRAIVTKCTAHEGPLHIELGGGMFPAPSGTVESR